MNSAYELQDTLGQWRRATRSLAEKTVTKQNILWCKSETVKTYLCIVFAQTAVKSLFQAAALCSSVASFWIALSAPCFLKLRALWLLSAAGNSLATQKYFTQPPRRRTHDDQLIIRTITYERFHLPTKYVLVSAATDTMAVSLVVHFPYDWLIEWLNELINSKKTELLCRLPPPLLRYRTDSDLHVAWLYECSVSLLSICSLLMLYCVLVTFATS